MTSLENIGTTEESTAPRTRVSRLPRRAFRGGHPRPPPPARRARIEALARARAAAIAAVGPLVRGAHVRADHAARALDRDDLRARVRAAAPALDTGLRRAAGRDALHAQLVALLRGRVRARAGVARVARAGAGAARARARRRAR